MSAHGHIPGKLVDGLFRKLLLHELTAELVTLLAEAGVDVSVPAAEAYPRAVWYRAIELTAAALYPAEPPPGQLHRLGRHVIDSWQRRGIKGPWLGVAKLMGPRRAMKQAAELAGKYSPVRLEVHDQGKSAVEIRVDEGQQPEFLAGLLEGVIGVLGGKDAHVHVTGAAPEKGVFAATWR